MAGRTPLRFLAPIALLAFAFALYTVVDNARKPAGNAASTTPTQTATPTPKASKHKHKRKVYVVKSGDTASGISAKTGVSLATMRTLNKHFDPQSLSPGQRIRLS